MQHKPARCRRARRARPRRIAMRGTYQVAVEHPRRVHMLKSLQRLLERSVRAALCASVWRALRVLRNKHPNYATRPVCTAAHLEKYPAPMRLVVPSLAPEGGQAAWLSRGVQAHEVRWRSATLPRRRNGDRVGAARCALLHKHRSAGRT